MISKFIGGVLLIVGTSIGAGMLALPIANAELGFWYSTLWLIGCWVLMTAGAFLLLEATLYVPVGSHMTSMAAAMLGKWGLLVTWLSYLLLLYALLCAYISGGTDVFQGLLAKISFTPPFSLLATLFTLTWGFIVYLGIREVDWVNRVLMFGKLGIFVLLIFLIFPFSKTTLLATSSGKLIHPSVMILITSFGYAIIIPNLRDYFKNNIPSLKHLIIIGSLIPLICYIVWDAIIIGTIPSHGQNGLINLIHSSQATSTLANTLSNVVNNATISSLFNAFTAICMLTAFLGVSLALMSFLRDGLKFQTTGTEGLLLFIFTYLPPLILVLFFPGAYLYALNYAGYLCCILLLILPALMVWNGRKKFLQKKPNISLNSWQPITVLILTIGLIILTFMHK